MLLRASGYSVSASLSFSETQYLEPTDEYGSMSQYNRECIAHISSWLQITRVTIAACPSQISTKILACGIDALYATHNPVYGISWRGALCNS
jgi:hypothetical protein